jgi:hypothetical protein
VTTDPRDPVADLIAIVERGGFIEGRRHPTLASRVRWLLAGVVVGIVSTLWWAGAAAQVPPAAEAYRRDLVRAAQSVHGLDAPIASLGAQIMVESAFRPDAVSWAGAQGLGQVMPATAAGLARQYRELRPVNVFDPRWSLHAATLLMRDLTRQFAPVAANACEARCYAATAYNGGPRLTQRRIDASPAPARCFGVTSRIAPPGIRPSAQVENERYPVAVLLRWEPRFVEAGWGRGVCGSYSHSKGDDR